MFMRMFCPIGHVRYINILTWFPGFQDKALYLVLFSLHWELRDKRCNFDPKAQAHVRILIYRTGPIGSDVAYEKLPEGRSGWLNALETGIFGKTNPPCGC